MRCPASLLLIASLFTANLALAASASVDINLTPAGSFKGKTADVKGFATLKGDEVSAQNIVVNLQSLKTGIELRDKHTLKHLDVAKFPQAVLLMGKGKGGKGVGKIRIRGIEKPIEGTYKINGNELNAEFKLSLKDFNITGIKYMGVGVEDQVSLQVAVPVKKGP
ncbi:MAG: YceI family protein [Bdellovibrionaceae bacterium]|nr:YceI family protein [Pseudobdellovibrionaceae bacterium]